jgi:hypothetical protein
MAKARYTLKFIIIHELDCGDTAYAHNQAIATAAIIVDRTFVRPTYTDRTNRWSQQDKNRYARAVQEVLATF